jgi:hypothetical protein
MILSYQQSLLVFQELSNIIRQISAVVPPVAKCASGICKSVAIPRTN